MDVAEFDKFADEYHAILKLLRPLEKYLTWFPLGAQHFVVGKKL